MRKGSREETAQEGGRSSGERRVVGWVEVRGALLINWIVNVWRYIVCICGGRSVNVSDGDGDGDERRSQRMEVEINQVLAWVVVGTQ